MKNEGNTPDASPLHEGQLVSHGNFTLKDPLRDDVTGAVWLAARTETPEELRELRFLPRALAETPEKRALLRDVVKKVTELEHPGLARIYGYIREDDEDILCEEHFNAPSLTDLAFDQPRRVFRESAVRAWLPQALDALEYAHGKACLAHGFICPQNILISPQGQLKFIEFQLARVLRDILLPHDPKNGRDGASYNYASPERVAGKDLGPAEDLYALGATLYELFTGQAPFAREPAAAAPAPIAKIRRRNAPSAEPLTREMEALISACLLPDLAKRPTSIADLRSLLETGSFVASQPAPTPKAVPAPEPAPAKKEPAPEPAPVPAEPASTPTAPAALKDVVPVTPVAARKKSPLAALAVVALLAALAIGGWQWMSSQEPAPEAGAITTTPASSTPAQEVDATASTAIAAAPTPVAVAPAAPLGAPNSPAEQKMAQARQDEIRKLLSTANDSLQNGNFEEALVNYSTVVSLTREFVGDAPPAGTPPSAEGTGFIQAMRESAAYAWHGRGECHFEQGLYRDALKEFEQALAINGRNDQSLARMAQCQLELLMLNEAKVTIDKSLELNPNQANAILALGRWQVVSTQEFEAALKTLDRSIELRPELAEAYYWKGKAYGGLRQYEEERKNLARAEAGFTQILDHRPLAARWLGFRGSSRLWLNQFRAAVDDFTEVIRMLPNYGFGYANRGYALLRLDQTRKAIGDLDQAIALEPRLASNFVNRGDAYLRLGEAQRAAEDYTRALTLEPENPVAWHNRAVAHLRMNRYQAALADFDKAIELDPLPVVPYLNKANALFAAEDLPAAIRTFNEVLTRDPKNALAYRDRGSAHFATGLYAEAIEDFTKAIELNSKDAQSYSRRGTAYDASGKFEEALADFTKALELNPNEPRAYRARADAYATLNQMDKADADLTKAEELERRAKSDVTYMP